MCADFTKGNKLLCLFKKCKVKNPNTTPQLQKNLMQSLSSKSFIEIIFYKIQSELHQDPDCILLNNVEIGYSWRNLKQPNGLAQLMITKGKLRFPRVPVMKVRSQRTMDTAYRGMCNFRLLTLFTMGKERF